MREKVFLFLDKLSNGSYAFEALVLVFIGVALIFSLNLILSVFKTGYGAKKRIFTSAISASLCALPLVFLVENQGKISLFFLCLSCLFNSFVFFIRTKPFGCQKTEGIKDLTEKENDVKKFSPLAEKIKKIEKLELSRKEETPPVKPKTDFSHVKNVIERLNAFPLSTADKKQIKELEDGIILIENGAIEDYGINDGLGALLKIMAKYGV